MGVGGFWGPFPPGTEGLPLVSYHKMPGDEGQAREPIIEVGGLHPKDRQMGERVFRIQ